MFIAVDTWSTAVGTCLLAHGLLSQSGMQTISIEHLHLIVGGADQAPTSTIAPQTPAQPTSGLSDAELESRFLEKEEFTRWEKRHPFSAMICQGDRSCMR